MVGSNIGGARKSCLIGRGDLTPPAPLSSFAATPLVERGEEEALSWLRFDLGSIGGRLSGPPSPRSIAKQCGVGEGGWGVRSVGRCACRDVINAQWRGDPAE